MYFVCVMYEIESVLCLVFTLCYVQSYGSPCALVGWALMALPGPLWTGPL